MNLWSFPPLPIPMFCKVSAHKSSTLLPTRFSQLFSFPRGTLNLPAAFSRSHTCFLVSVSPCGKMSRTSLLVTFL
jgi:hypothetical protein